MKNFLIVLILAALVIPAAPISAGAAAFSDAVRMDFSDFTAADSGGGTYKTYFTYGNIAGNTSAKTVTAERGVSVEMLSPSAGDQYINWRAEFSKNAVFGFSVYPADMQAGFGVALKGVSGQWDDTSINSFITVSGGSITLNGSPVYSYTGPEWIDIAVAMNYQTHTIALYVNNEFKGTMTMKEAVVGCQYMNLSLQKNKTGTDGKPAKLYFDDFISYYPSSARITNDFDSSIVNAGEIDSITLAFGQNVILEDMASAVAVNGEYMEITPVYQYGFITGAMVPLQNLMPKTEYTITLNGVRNLIGEALTYSYKFSTIDDSPMVSVSSDYQGKKLPEGARVDISLSSANLAAGDTIELYLNGELAAQAPADAKSAAILLRGGVNRIYAKVAGTGVISNTIELEAIGYTRLSDEYANDFEGANPLGGLGRGAGDGKLEVVESDREHGNSLYYEFDGSSTEAKDIPFIVLPAVTGKKGIYVVEAEYKFSTVQKTDNLLKMKTDNNKWNTTFVITNGTLTANGVPVKSDMKAETWYKFKVMYHIEHKTVSMFVDDALVIYETPLATSDFDSVQYINMAIGAISGETVWQLVDNIKSWFQTENFDYTAEFTDGSGKACGIDAVPYQNAAVRLAFDREMAADSLAGISIVDRNGNKSALDGAYVYETDASGAVVKSEFTAPLGELKPNTEYYLELEDVKTLMGGKSAGEPVEFKTEKSPFCIDGVSYSASGGILTVKVNLRNVSGEMKTAALTAGAYGALEMYAVGAKSVSTGADASYTFTMAEPKDSYTVEVYLFDDMSSLRLIDKAAAE